MKLRCAAVASLSCLLMPTPSFADERTPQQQQVEALSAISNTAIKLCPEKADTSNFTDTEIKASIDAELSGLVKKLANLGVHPSGNYKNVSTQGVLQADLASVIKATYDCRVKTMTLLLGALLPSSSR